MRLSYREWRLNNATPGLFEAEYTSSTPVCTEKARTISMTIKGLIFGLCVSVAASSAALAQQDNYTVRLVAGAAGYDHIQPFLAEHLKLWDKYGVKVEFMGGNYQRSNQMMSIGDFDVGYNQYASSMRYLSAGIDSVIVAASSANCAMMVPAPTLQSWADLKGQRI